MINLITVPLKEKDEYAYHEIEVDSIRDICQLTGDDVTYSDCDGCENCGHECKYKKYVRVDVSFWDGADCQRNYVFGNKQTECKGICRIKNRKQLMTEMAKLKKELESYKDWCSEFGERYDEYLSYAKEFAQEVKNKYYLLFGLVQTEILPVIFHTDYNMRNGVIDYRTLGNLQIVEKQNVINVFCCMDDVEETKCTIRHEVLHYMLYIAGLKYKDDTAIFHHFCKEFDASAYKEMCEDEQTLYDRLNNAVPMLDELLKSKILTEESYESNYLSVLLAVGSGKDHSLYGKLYENGMEILEILELKSKIA